MNLSQKAWATQIYQFWLDLPLHHFSFAEACASCFFSPSRHLFLGFGQAVTVGEMRVALAFKVRHLVLLKVSKEDEDDIPWPHSRPYRQKQDASGVVALKQEHFTSLLISGRRIGTQSKEASFVVFGCYNFSNGHCAQKTVLVIIRVRVSNVTVMDRQSFRIIAIVAN